MEGIVQGEHSSNPENAMSSKIIAGLKTFQSDKARFRMWNDKLVNALTTIAPDMRKFMNKLMAKVDQDKNGYIDLQEFIKGGGIIPTGMTWEQI